MSAGTLALINQEVMQPIDAVRKNTTKLPA